MHREAQPLWVHNGRVNDVTTSDARPDDSDGRTASRVFSALWADQSRRAWFVCALAPAFVSAVVTVLFVAMQVDRHGTGVAPATVRMLTADAIDASRIYVPVATAAFTVWVTLVAFTALAGADSAERTAILLRLRAVVQMTLAVGWTAAISLAVLVAFGRTDAWPVIGMLVVLTLLTAAFAALSALYLVVGNAGMRRDQLQRIVDEETERQGELRARSEERPLWTRVLVWGLVFAVVDVAVTFVAFTTGSALLRLLVLVLFQLGYTVLLAYDAYLGIRRPSSLGWFPRTGQRALIYLAVPLGAVWLAFQLTDGWMVALAWLASVALPVAAVRAPRGGIAGGLSRLAARGLEVSVRRYAMHLAALTRPS